MGMLKEFREFALRGNVIDMAVGIVIGGAFGKIVSSLVNDVIMPPLGLLSSAKDFSGLVIKLREKSGDIPAIVISYGTFINTIVDFVIVAFAIFLVIKQINRLKREPPPAAPTQKDCPRCFTAIPLKATRCPHCTSEITPK
jgi:large conductance mechanosensitive channel